MFLIFGGQEYYASGGGYDLLGIRIRLGDACKFAEECLGKIAVTEKGKVQGWDAENDIEWTHVVDGETGVIVANYGGKPHGGGKGVVEIKGGG